MQLCKTIMRVLIIGVLLGAPAAAAQDSPVRAMMEQSGMVEQFADLGQTMSLGILQAGQQHPTMPPDAAEALADMAAHQFDGQRFLQKVETVLADTLSAAEIEVVDDFYASEL